jgi:CxxC motif-containing protein (DUF1111 family)
VFFLVSLVASIGVLDSLAEEARAQHRPRRERFTASGSVEPEARAAASLAAPEAPAGFDNLTNGYLPQGPSFDGLTEDTVDPLASFNEARFVFEAVEDVADGLGPTYNAQSCRECHQSVVTGGASQIAEHRTGRLEHGVFFASMGGSLLHSRATNADIVEHVAVQDGVRTFRISTNTLGDGFVEAIANSTLLALRDAQPFWLRGTAVPVPVLEADGQVRIGRFGWKSQHASLESFAADAYLNEMGITTPLLPDENTSSGRFVGFGSGYDEVADPEDDGEDARAFAEFMRSTKVPPRGADAPEVRAGEQWFRSVGCDGCHVASIVTAPAGTRINGGSLTVPAALGDKLIHPYSDFLLHDVGTGDGIPVQAGPAFAATANQIRTAPLWGLRTRNRLMHDGLSFTTQEAILRHRGQATPVVARFQRLTPRQRGELLAFLDSL